MCSKILRVLAMSCVINMADAPSSRTQYNTEINVKIASFPVASRKLGNAFPTGRNGFTWWSLYSDGDNDGQVVSVARIRSYRPTRRPHPNYCVAR